METKTQSTDRKPISGFNSSKKSSSKRSVISSFPKKYKIKKTPSTWNGGQKTKDTTADKSSNSSSDDEELVYHLDLESPRAFNSKDMSYIRTNQKQELFETLSTISKVRLQKFEDEKTFSKDEINSLRIFKGDSIMEFDDFINLNYFNQKISRESLSCNFAGFRHENLFVFNNLKDVACLTLDVDMLSFVISKIYVPREDEFVSFVNVGTGNYRNVVLIGLMGARKISFFNVEKREKMFDFEFVEIDECPVNAVNNGNDLFVLFLDNKIRKFSIEDESLLAIYDLSGVSGLRFITDIQVVSDIILISSNLGIHMLQEETDNFKLIFSEPEENLPKEGKSRYIFASNGNILLIARKGGAEVHFVNYAKDGITTTLNFKTEETHILDLTVNQNFTEFAVLFEMEEDGKKLRKVSLGYIHEDKIEDFDLILVGDNVTIVKYFANSDHFLAEGEGTFSVFETKNQELTNSLKKKIEEEIKGDGLGDGAVGDK